MYLRTPDPTRLIELSETPLQASSSRELSEHHILTSRQSEGAHFKMAARQDQINLDTLSAQQLTAVKKQLDEEVEHLTSSYSQLHAALGKFRDCLRCVQQQGASASSGRDAKKNVLVPLTNSLYVGGQLTNPDRVLVDIGTGFYIEKDTKSAATFYEEKIKELGGNVSDLEKIVQGKTQNLRVVEEVLRQKVLAENAK
ncbi:uncharacterized protein E0L32_003055 [Thyridium curvatum]|uniref:Prefoldin subunit 5 n=1 Tax=Thyridium curvatum TaxID=1093900 RepID=A0A507B580_9PEZI|nr:uncharacterized protein E0L32_003055 [Thyridium curvatum]TPX17412.1 hypothetical protein E0L32_003055 [Thyridium curvatum]